MIDTRGMEPWFDSMAQGVQVAQHLNQAAIQMQQLKQEKEAQQQRQALAQQEFDAQQQQSIAQNLATGAKSVGPDGNVQMPAPPAANPNFGMPGTGDQPISLPQSGTANVPADMSRTYTIAGRTLEAPTIQETLDRETKMQQAKENALRVPVSDDMADFLGLQRGSSVNPDVLARGGAARAQVAADRAASQGPKLVAHDVRTDDKGNQSLIRVFDDGSVKETPLSSKGKSDRFGNPELAAAETSARAMTENQRQASAEKSLSDYQKLVTQKAQIERENRNIQIALGSTTPTHYVDKDGNLTAFEKGNNSIPKEARDGYLQENTARLQANLERLKQVVSDMQGAQNRYADLSGNNGARPTQAVTPAAQAPSGQPVAAPAASTPAPANKPAPANQPAPQRKVASMADISAYAKKQNITVDAAKKIALGKGYEIGQ